MFETLIILVGILLVIAAIGDLREFKIPNWIPASISLLYMGATLLSLSTFNLVPQIAWLPSLVISGAIFIAFTFLFALGHMGGGDVKLITATSLWAGPNLILDFLLGMALAGGLLSLVFIMRSKILETRLKTPFAGHNSAPSPSQQSPLPYGVAIAAGGLIIVQSLLMSALTKIS